MQDNGDLGGSRISGFVVYGEDNESSGSAGSVNETDEIIYINESDNENDYFVKERVPDFNIWDFYVGGGNSTNDKIAFEHPAIFPESLAEDHILSWSEEGDLVLCDHPKIKRGLSRGISHKYFGPFVIQKIEENQVDYVIKRLGIKNGKRYKIHQNRFKFYHASQQTRDSLEKGEEDDESSNDEQPAKSKRKYIKMAMRIAAIPISITESCQ
jgi:hypothetical protein